MSETALNANGQQQYRLFILFNVQGDARFFSHRETQTIWQRAMVRAKIPVCYSKGFNPHIKMSLPLPRSVSVGSVCELVVVCISEQILAEEVESSLVVQLPEGVELIRTGYLPVKDTPLPDEVYYEIELHDHVDIQLLSERVTEFGEMDEYIVEREARGRHKARNLNIKENVQELNISDSLIRLVIKVSLGATARLEEIVQAVGLDYIEDVKLIKRVRTVYHGKIFNDLFGLENNC